MNRGLTLNSSPIVSSDSWLNKHLFTPYHQAQIRGEEQGLKDLWLNDNILNNPEYFKAIYDADLISRGGNNPAVGVGPNGQPLRSKFSTQFGLTDPYGFNYGSVPTTGGGGIMASPTGRMGGAISAFNSIGR